MNINDLDPKKDKELMQELGIVFLTEDIKGMKVKDIVVPMDHRPERIKVEGYEETREVYKYRRNMIKNIEKMKHAPKQFWDSSKMGTYVNMTEDEVQKKYGEISEKSTDEVAEELMKMDQKLRKLDKFGNESELTKEELKLVQEKIKENER